MPAARASAALSFPPPVSLSRLTSEPGATATRGTPMSGGDSKRRPQPSPTPRPVTPRAALLRIIATPNASFLVNGDAELIVVNCRIARMIYKARKETGLMQAQLVEAVGTTQSVIARLEDAAYEGRSLSMLQRIAEALDRRISIDFEPAVEEGRTTS